MTALAPWRAASVLLTSAIAGLLLLGAPGLNQLGTISITFLNPPLRLNPLAFFESISLFVGLVAFFVRKARLILYSYVIAAISWALVGSTRFAWWLLQSPEQSLFSSPTAGTIVLVALTVFALLVYLLIDALETYQKAALERGVPAAVVRSDLLRIAASYGVLCSVAVTIGVLLLTAFEGVVADAGWVPQLKGDAWGAWILLLIGTLVFGVLIMLGRAKSSGPSVEEWKSVP